jgi:dTDP-4-dehydrorhamnose reductase
LRLLLLGSHGQIGWELERSLFPLGALSTLSHSDIDLADTDAVRVALRAVRPHIVVNAAAYTAVDKAEAEAEMAFAVNALAPRALAEECRRIGSLLVHYSTDYVFDGTSASPYSEAEPPAPLNVYGESKAAGDQAIADSGCAHMIFRTSWIYASRGSNFVRTMLRLAREKKAMEVIDDQIGAPTCARQVAEATTHALALAAGTASGDVASLSTQYQGVFNLSAAGSTTWHGFAAAIFQIAGMAPSLAAVRSADFPRPAKRPKNSLLSNERFQRTFGFRLPDWRIGLQLCIDELRDSGRLMKFHG